MCYSFNFSVGLIFSNKTYRTINQIKIKILDIYPDFHSNSLSTLFKAGLMISESTVSLIYPDVTIIISTLQT